MPENPDEIKKGLREMIWNLDINSKQKQLQAESFYEIKYIEQMGMSRILLL